MRAPVRYALSLLLAALLEAAFVALIPKLLQPAPKEVSQVIQISLFKPQVKTTTVKVEREKGKKEVKREERKAIKPPMPRVEAEVVKKELPQKEVKEEKVKEKKRGGLKPLQGNLPADYLEAVRLAIQENVFYPLEAIEEGIEGPVMVQFTLDRNGRVVECKPIFGHRLLTEATCLAINRSKFPPIPKSVKNDRLTFQLQVEFDLKEALGR